MALVGGWGLGLLRDLLRFGPWVWVQVQVRGLAQVQGLGLVGSWRPGGHSMCLKDALSLGGGWGAAGCTTCGVLSGAVVLCVWCMFMCG